MSYTAVITKLKNIRPHANADRLRLATCYGNQVVIGLTEQEGDIGIFFPCDGQLSEEYAKEHDLVARKDEAGNRAGGYFDSNRRIRAQRFRGERSDGFWMPIESLKFTGYDISKLKEGDEVTSLNDVLICQKYVTSATREARGKTPVGGKRFASKKLYTMFKEHVDTGQFASSRAYLIPRGSLITITEKVHGTSARTGNVKVTTRYLPWYRKLLAKAGLRAYWNYSGDWEVVSGTRRVVLRNNDKEDAKSYYGTNDFRMPYHHQLKDMLFKGETIYYEIVGYVGSGSTIMPSCDNKKLGDKEFVKQYGPQTTFKYGCLDGTSRIFVYRITMTNEDGFTVDYPYSAMVDRCNQLGLQSVPLLHDPIIYDGDLAMLTELVDNLCDGPSTIDQSHIREGCVVRYEFDNNFNALKHKNFCFKVLEGIIKDSGVADMEEAQEALDEQETTS